MTNRVSRRFKAWCDVCEQQELQPADGDKRPPLFTTWWQWTSNEPYRATSRTVCNKIKSNSNKAEAQMTSRKMRMGRAENN